MPGASSSIDFRKWFDRFQPQTLQIATWLLYISGVFMLIDLGNRGSWVWFAKERYGIGLFVVLVLVACHALGGLLMANDRKLGYWLALVAAFSPFVVRLWVLRGTDATTMDRITGGYDPRLHLRRRPRGAAAAPDEPGAPDALVQVTAMAKIIDGIPGLKALAGEHLGYSDYLEITQDRVNLFADATGDHQWIHVDVERAKAGPFGGPIAHGYLTLSLGPSLAPQIYTVQGINMAVNYGAGKVRFPSPCRSAPSCGSAPSWSASRTSPATACRSRWSSPSRSRARRSRRASPS